LYVAICPVQWAISASSVDHGARPRPDPGHHLLPVFRSLGTPITCASCTPGWRVQELLDLARVDVLAAADDHVLDAPDDVDVALVVHRREVAGVHPAGGVDGVRASASLSQ
jgi:hypothetical protein